MVRENLEKRYLELGNELPVIHNDLDFNNHCYWRIALDHNLGDKWDQSIGKPAYKNLSDAHLLLVVASMESYKLNVELLQEHNKKSLGYRGKP